MNALSPFHQYLVIPPNPSRRRVARNGHTLDLLAL
jgi:hypothetical protein